MKYFCSLAIMTCLLVGCGSRAGTGAVVGGAIGAGTGALIGQGEGALIGGAVGVAAGALMGSYLDEQERQVMERTSPRTVERIDRGELLTVNDVIKLSQGGISDETIIQYINNSGASYNLSQAQVRRMQEAGVSQRVINFMINSGK